MQRHGATGGQPHKTPIARKKALNGVAKHPGENARGNRRNQVAEWPMQQLAPPPPIDHNRKPQDIARAIDRASFFAPSPAHAQNRIPAHGRHDTRFQPPLPVGNGQYGRHVEGFGNPRNTRPRPAAEFLDGIEQSSQDGRMMELLGLTPLSAPDLRSHLENSAIPPGYRDSIIRMYEAGVFSGNVARYYLEVVPRGDSRRVPGQGHRRWLAQAVLTNKTDDSQWSCIRTLGKGGYGAVILWEKRCKNGKILRLAVKDTPPGSFFVDYCSEGHLTRRLNDLGCENVINVVTWIFMQERSLFDEVDGVWINEPSRHRICYEFAEHGDLHDLVKWYERHGLIIPQAFIWHVLYSMANALCYCRYGNDRGISDPGWDPIVHGDLKECNIFLGEPDQSQHKLYPCIKLGDFGLSYTTGINQPEVVSLKSAMRYGTRGYQAPEVESAQHDDPQRIRSPLELHGPQVDIWSLEVTFRRMMALLEPHRHILYQKRCQAQSRGEPYSLSEVVYGTDLAKILAKCGLRDPGQRISARQLYWESKQQMERFRSTASEERTTAIRANTPFSCYRSRVLYTAAERRQFQVNARFREHYTMTNLEPLWDIAAVAQQAEQLMAEAQPMKHEVNFEVQKHVKVNPPERLLRSKNAKGIWLEQQKKRDEHSREFRLVMKSRISKMKSSRGPVSAARHWIERLKIWKG